MIEFNCTISKEGNKFIYNMYGVINEIAKFPEDNLSNIPTVYINLDKIVFINSTGVGNWVKWLREKIGDRRVIFRNIPPVIVNQMNNVAGFLPIHFEVESLYVPYYSEEDDVEENFLLKSGEHFLKDSEGQPGWVKIKEKTQYKGHNLELDVNLQKYFKFLIKDL